MACKTKACCDTTVDQKPINNNVSFSIDDNDVLTLIIGNKIMKVQLDLDGGSIGGGANPSITIPIISNGQTLFTNAIPEGFILADVYLNGVLQDNDHYTTSGVSNRNLVWLDTVEQPLETTDTLKIIVNTIPES